MTLGSFEVAIKERDRVSHRPDFQHVRLICATIITLHVNETALIVIVGFPSRVLARFLEQVVRHAKYSLQFIAIAPLNENRGADRADSLLGNILSNPASHLVRPTH